MPIFYDDAAGALAIGSEYCGDCEGPLYDTGCDAPGCRTGCDAPGCRGYRCDNCGTGCDLDFDDTGRCWTAMASESSEDYSARVNAERVAFGLSPIATEGE